MTAPAVPDAQHPLGRGSGTGARLAAAGFRDAAAARTAVERLGVTELLPLFGTAADPDLALRSLQRLVEALPQPGELLEHLRADEGTAMRVLAVLGASDALGDHLVRHPHQWRDLNDPHLGDTRPTSGWIRATLLEAVGADPAAAAPRASIEDSAACDALRVEYRRLLTRLVARDLTHHLSLTDTAAELSDLASGALEAALAVARSRVGETSNSVRLGVLAMGKCGGHELNYVSDVDVIFVHEPAPGADDRVAARAAQDLAAHLIQVCSAHTAEGTLWPVDANLRPEGRNGPLSRTLASHASYYERWAKTWEYQALLKARPAAGDLVLAQQWVETVEPQVWTAAERPGFVEDTRAMRRRVVEHIGTRQAVRELKLGTGGLRDVEFAVQLLQLVHGRADRSLRDPGTLPALAALTVGGYVAREDGEALAAAYTFLRRLEHRMQLFGLQRVHVVPDDEEALRRLGRSLGLFKDPAAALEREWRHHRLEVRRLHEKIFYRPLLAAVARIPGPGARLSLEAARDRMAALGYADPKAALRHLEALSSGVSRRATIQRTLLPVMLEWFAQTPDPDAGVSGFRRISEALGQTPWYLRTLRDEGEVAERLATLLGTSPYLTDLLEREPRGVQLLGGDLTPREVGSLNREMSTTGERHHGAEAAVAAIRGVRRRELFRIAAGDLFGTNDLEAVGAGLSHLTDATLQSTLDVVSREETRRRGLAEDPSRMAVVAMGRYGGFELSYGSDADVMFVHDPRPGVDAHLAATWASAVARRLRELLARPASDPALEVDADLRPEGRQGPLVRTLDAYAAYYGTWSQTWEFQALLRADAVVGDAQVRQRFTDLVDPLRFRPEGLTDDQVREIRRIKARVDGERMPRGADPQTHLKLGRGGLADVEWTVQLLQMQHGGAVPAMRTTRTVAALEAAVEAGLVPADDAERLMRAWRLVSRVRNAATLVTGRTPDQLPSRADVLGAVGQVLGYPAGDSGGLLNDYLRTTRLAHEVVERIFWGG